MNINLYITYYTQVLPAVPDTIQDRRSNRGPTAHGAQHTAHEICYAEGKEHLIGLTVDSFCQIVDDL